MYNHKVTESSDKTFESDVLKNSRPVLVDFWAPWCGPCRMVAPVLEEIATDLDGKLEVKKINVDENPAVAGSLGVNAIPTLVLFNKGRAVKAWLGVQPKAQLMQEISPLI